MRATRAICTGALPERAGENPSGEPSGRVAEHVRRNYGPWADRVLSEGRDPCFCNPLIGVSLKNGTVFNRLEESWRWPWSVQEPEPGSLTEFYRKTGRVQFTRKGPRFVQVRGGGAEAPEPANEE